MLLFNFRQERELILGGDPTEKLFETTLIEVIQGQKNSMKKSWSGLKSF